MAQTYKSVEVCAHGPIVADETKAPGAVERNSLENYSHAPIHWSSTVSDNVS